MDAAIHKDSDRAGIVVIEECSRLADVKRVAYETVAVDDEVVSALNRVLMTILMSIVLKGRVGDEDIIDLTHFYNSFNVRQRGRCAQNLSRIA